MQKGKFLLRILPITTVDITLAFTWIDFVLTSGSSTTKHLLALILFALNTVIYFFSVRIGVLITGLLLIVAALNWIAIFSKIEYTSYFLKLGNVMLSTPPIQGKSLLILIGYFATNIGYLVDSYADFRFNGKQKR